MAKNPFGDAIQRRLAKGKKKKPPVKGQQPDNADAVARFIQGKKGAAR